MRSIGVSVVVSEHVVNVGFTTIAVIATVVAPQVINATDLGWSPPVPEIGQVVAFIVTEHGDNILSEWDFGENGCQSNSRFFTCSPNLVACDRVVFRFASGGEKSVAVTIKDPNTGSVLGSADVVLAVDDTGSCMAMNDDVFVLQSYYAVGADNSLYTHAMEVFNPEVDEAWFRVDWLPRGWNNSTPLKWAVVPVPGETSVRFGNALENLLDGYPEMAGALRIEPTSSSLVFSNHGLRSLNGVSDGWVIPEIRRSEGFVSGEEGYIINLRESVDYRSNIACVNLTESSILVLLDMHDISGAHLWSANIGMASSSNNQINSVFSDFAPVEGFVKVTTDYPDDAFTCMGMVVANDTNDTRTEFIQDPSELDRTYYLPRVIYENDSSTDVAVMAPNGPAVIRFDLFPTGQDNTVFPSSSEFSIPAGTEIRIPDVLDSVFGFTGTASLRIVTLSGEVAVSAHETTAPPGNIRHRAVGVRPLAEHTPAGNHAAIIQLTENADHRTDIGLVNTSIVTINVWIDLRDAVGNYLGGHLIEVLPNSHLEIKGVFALIGHPDVADAIARISTRTHRGSFLGYAVVTELNTLDSWELVPFEVPEPPFADDFELGHTGRWSSSAP